MSSAPDRINFRLYVVTDRYEAAGRDLEEIVAAAAQGGAGAIQLREKDLSGRELAQLINEVLRKIGGSCTLLINDRLDAAIANRAAGVHLGEQSLPLAEASRLGQERRSNERFFVGASAHSLAVAQQAEKAGADYLVFGPIFATPSKAAFGAPQGVAKLREACAGLKIPVIAIGGITAENYAQCLEAGAAGIAAIRLFQDAENLPELVSRLRTGA